MATRSQPSSIMSKIASKLTELLPLDCLNFHYLQKNPCLHFVGLNFVPNFLILGQNYYPY